MDAFYREMLQHSLPVSWQLHLPWAQPQLGTGTDPHQHLPGTSMACFTTEHGVILVRRVPGGYQALPQSRANLKVRSCFFNKLSSRGFREGLTAKQIISRFFPKEINIDSKEQTIVVSQVEPATNNGQQS